MSIAQGCTGLSLQQGLQLARWRLFPSPLLVFFSTSYRLGCAIVRYIGQRALRMGRKERG